MKNSISYISLALFVILFTSCGNNEVSDDMPPSSNINEFTINENSFETQNAYLIFETFNFYDIETMMDVKKFKDQFNFVFTNGTLIENENDIYYSLDTRQVSFNHFRDNAGGGIYDSMEDIIIQNILYELSPSTTVVYNANIQSEVVDGGNQYGALDGISLLLANEDITSFEIEEIAINYELMEGTIKCKYSISPSWEGPISGNYTGSFKVLVR